MSVNPTKCEVTFFFSWSEDAKRRPAATIDGADIKYSEKPRFLGVHLDRTLTFNKHTEETAKKVKQRNRALSAIATMEWGSRLLCTPSKCRDGSPGSQNLRYPRQSPGWSTDAHYWPNRINPGRGTTERGRRVLVQNTQRQADSNLYREGRTNGQRPPKENSPGHGCAQAP